MPKEEADVDELETVTGALVTEEDAREGVSTSIVSDEATINSFAISNSAAGTLIEARFDDCDFENDENWL